jgi:putative Ca2+/H+ antiporter (TMEM165/GDT1 family)
VIGSLPAAFAAIASALFVTELTDKDAFLLLALAAKVRAVVVFLAGVTAFVTTTAVFVTAGTLVGAVVPVLWVKLVGGAIMISYGLWQVRSLLGWGAVREEVSRLERHTGGWKAFFGIVAALALLDIAGDATEVLTIVLVVQYSDAVLVFFAACTGLIAATALETALGNRIGKMLAPNRLRYVSAAVFLVLGTLIITSSLA